MNATIISKKYLPRLIIQRDMVRLQSSRSNKKPTWSTNIFTPLYHLSPEHKTMPLWVDESVWKLFLESDYEFDKRGFHKSINETPNDSEKIYMLLLKRQRLVAN